MAQSPTRAHRAELSSATNQTESATEREAKEAIQRDNDVISKYRELLEAERSATKQSKDLYETTITQLTEQVQSLMQKNEEEEKTTSGICCRELLSLVNPVHTVPHS